MNERKILIRSVEARKDNPRRSTWEFNSSSRPHETTILLRSSNFCPLFDKPRGTARRILSSLFFPNASYQGAAISVELEESDMMNIHLGLSQDSSGVIVTLDGSTVWSGSGSTGQQSLTFATPPLPTLMAVGLGYDLNRIRTGGIERFNEITHSIFCELTTPHVKGSSNHKVRIPMDNLRKMLFTDLVRQGPKPAYIYAALIEAPDIQVTNGVEPALREMAIGSTT